MNGLSIIFIVFVVMLVLRVPIAYCLGLSGMAYIAMTGNFDMTSFASVMVRSVDSFPLMAVPFFILAGALMTAGGISKQIVQFATALVGRVTGGLARVAVVACAFFAALSGSGIATTAAIGAIMIPEMEKNGYAKPFSAALIAAAGCLGPIIPPSVPMVMFGASTETSISAMLIGGLLPGVLLAALLMVFAYFYAKKNNIKKGGSFSPCDIARSFLSAIPALLVPMIILGGIYSGLFTPTEAAAVAVVYSLFAGTVIYREINLKNLKAALVDSAAQTGNIMIIAAAATFFARMLTMEQFHTLVKNFVLGATSSKIIVMLLLNVILLLLGCLMDTTPIILVFAPILLPVATAYGVNPVHFGVMMCANLAIGLITPPVGVSLYVAAGQADVPFTQVLKNIYKPLAMLLIGLMVITYCEPFVTLLPRLLGVMK